MKCVYCGSIDSKVIDKRAVRTADEIRRRRECLKCHKRFTTYEKVADLGFLIVKRDGRKEPFDREKLSSGLIKALEKRPDIDKVIQIVERIEGKLRRKGEKEIKSRVVGQLVLLELKKLDKIAYLRFASVYRQFTEPGDFARELQGLN
jgi:transcriptional repressor NrdR